MTTNKNFNYSPLTTEELITDSKRKVLTCPGCQKIFNRNSRIPFTLPCSHILCKECVSKSICPLDKKKIIDTNSLIICQTFLDFLPKKNFYVIALIKNLLVICALLIMKFFAQFA